MAPIILVSCQVFFAYIHLGIGAIYDTSTKRLTVPLCGIKGLREILKFAASQKPPVKTVAIGGLNISNVGRVRYQSETPSVGAKLDGVAIVSALMSVDNPRETASQLKHSFQGRPNFITPQVWSPTADLNANNLANEITKVLQTIQQETPLVHHLTNNVSPPCEIN
jgi:thiamine-phosphate diphosphorylase/hydroxyethylthiazole kinase